MARCLLSNHQIYFNSVSIFQSLRQQKLISIIVKWSVQRKGPINPEPHFREMFTIYCEITFIANDICMLGCKSTTNSCCLEWVDGRQWKGFGSWDLCAPFTLTRHHPTFSGFLCPSGSNLSASRRKLTTCGTDYVRGRLLRGNDF